MGLVNFPNAQPNVLPFPNAQPNVIPFPQAQPPKITPIKPMVPQGLPNPLPEPLPKPPTPKLPTPKLPTPKLPWFPGALLGLPGQLLPDYLFPEPTGDPPYQYPPPKNPISPFEPDNPYIPLGKPGLLAKQYIVTATAWSWYAEPPEPMPGEYPREASISVMGPVSASVAQFLRFGFEWNSGIRVVHAGGESFMFGVASSIKNFCKVEALKIELADGSSEPPGEPQGNPNSMPIEISPNQPLTAPEIEPIYPGLPLTVPLIKPSTVPDNLPDSIPDAPPPLLPPAPPQDIPDLPGVIPDAIPLILPKIPLSPLQDTPPDALPLLPIFPQVPPPKSPGTPNSPSTVPSTTPSTTPSTVPSFTPGIINPDQFTPTPILPPKTPDTSEDIKIKEIKDLLEQLEKDKFDCKKLKECLSSSGSNPSNNPALELISLPYTVCKLDPITQEHKAEKKFKVIYAAKNQISLSDISLFDASAELAKLGCEEPPELIAAVPEWWQVRAGGDRPQAVVLLREVKGTGYGSGWWSMTIPHYAKGKAFKPAIPDFTKGDCELVATLSDNSKFILNAKDRAECLKVWKYVKTLINPGMLTSKAPKIGDREGEYKKAKVRATRLQYFSQGQKAFNPDADFVVRLTT